MQVQIGGTPNDAKNTLFSAPPNARNEPHALPGHLVRMSSMDGPMSSREARLYIKPPMTGWRF